MSRKEELKAAYKAGWHRLRKMGVYQVRNQVNGKIFLEGSLNLEGTIARDRSWIDRGYHLNPRLSDEVKQFGPGAFTVEILEALTPTDDPRDYAGEVDLLLEAWKAQLEPYGEKGYLSPPRR